jgi:hypothetical protein
MRDADRITLKGRVGELAAWAIAGIAWLISYGTQVALARDHGFHGPSDWEAAGMGLLSDLASLACMMLALDQAERGKDSRLSWVLAGVSALMMEWANVVYAGSDPVAVILHGWPPFLAVSIVFLLVHVRRTNAAPAAGAVIASEPVRPGGPDTGHRTGHPDTRTGRLSGPGRRLPAARPEQADGSADTPDGITEDRFRAALQEFGPGATNRQLADRLGVHPDSVRRYRRRWPDAVRPRLMAGPDQSG